MSEIALSQRVLKDPRFRALVRSWVTEGLPRQWLVAQSRQLADVLAREQAAEQAAQSAKRAAS